MAQARPVADTGRLWSVMQSVPGLGAYVGDGKCLGSDPRQQGINIEGLAVREGRLYFGIRGIVLQVYAMVLSVDAEARVRPSLRWRGYHWGRTAEYATWWR